MWQRKSKEGIEPQKKPIFNPNHCQIHAFKRRVNTGLREPETYQTVHARAGHMESGSVGFLLGLRCWMSTVKDERIMETQIQRSIGSFTKVDSKLDLQEDPTPLWVYRMALSTFHWQCWMSHQLAAENHLQGSVSVSQEGPQAVVANAYCIDKSFLSRKSVVKQKAWNLLRNFKENLEDRFSCAIT